mmetsp:Transcript_32261/g.37216  ORF Transcript_32261/g.37216 Transcript_32261/m.37216 type:complete len:469 (-) Transcript_32261:202-1608(-)
MKTAILALLVLTFLGAYAQNAGVKVAVSPAAVKNFDDNVLPIFISKLESIKIPDVSEGKLSVSDIQVNKMSLPTNAIVANFGTNDLTFGTQNFGVDISAHARIKILFVKVSVHVSATCHDSSAMADIAFSYANPHPQISLKDFSVSIRNLDVKFGSSIIGKAASAIVNLFRGQIQDLVSKVISSSLKNTIGDAINNALQRVPNTADIPSTPLSIAYNLVAAPTVTPNSFTLAVDGSFYESSVGKATPPIAPAGPMPDYDAASGSQVQLFMHQYVLNSGLYSAWHAGMLKKEFDYNVFDGTSNFKFDIDWLKQFISQIVQYYSVDTQLVLDVFVKDTPTLTLAKGNVELNVTVEAAFSAVVGGNKVELFAADCNVDLNTSLSVENWTLEPKITGGTVQAMAIIRTSVGDIETDKMIIGMNQLAQIAIPKIDFSIAKFPLPTSLDVDMTTISLGIQDGYLQINANPVFKP